MSRGLTKAGIVAAALAVLDDSGIDGVTVRAVAGRLGVQAPALYWHVRDKQALLDEMATEIWRRVSAEVAALPGDWPWDRVMTQFAAITRRALLAHRDGAKVFTGTYLTDASVLEVQETRLARMTRAGFTADAATRGYVLLYDFTVGFCVEEQAAARAAAAGDDRFSPDRRARRLDPRSHPLVAAGGPVVLGDADTRFSGLVAVIIDAVDRMRRPGATAAQDERYR